MLSLGPFGIIGPIFNTQPLLQLGLSGLPLADVLARGLMLIECRLIKEYVEVVVLAVKLWLAGLQVLRASLAYVQVPDQSGLLHPVLFWLIRAGHDWVCMSSHYSSTTLLEDRENT